MKQARCRLDVAGCKQKKTRDFARITKFLAIAKLFCFMFLGTNDPVLVFSISTLTVMILFKIDWVFHLFVRLYKPSYEQFVT